MCGVAQKKIVSRCCSLLQVGDLPDQAGFPEFWQVLVL